MTYSLVLLVMSILTGSNDAYIVDTGLSATDCAMFDGRSKVSADDTIYMYRCVEE